MRFSVVLVALPVLSAGLSAQTAAVAEIRLGPGDQVRIEVAGEPGLSGDVFVDADGFALVPLVGLVEVGGRPFAEVARHIRVALGREVTAAVRVIPLLRIAVLGEVRVPGLYPVDPTMGLRDVLAAAGGVTEAGRRDDVRLVRSDSTLVTSVDAPGLPPLMSGDEIVVGRRSWFSQNSGFMIGAAASVVAAFVTGLIVR